MKKIIAYLLMATLAISLIGCAELDNPDSQNSSNQSKDEGDNTNAPDDIDNDKEADDEVKDDEEVEGQKEDDQDDKEPSEGEDKSDKDESDDKPEDTEVKATKGTLYFSDENAEFLNAEEREFDELTPESLVNGLIAGPKDDKNRKTIPDGTKLLDIKVEGGIANVSFSKELVEKHWGGSTGETHTIFSIVNTLTLNPDLNIDSVKILIDGESVDTLAGHMTLGEPIEPDLDLNKDK